jgi:hypothetical protein
MLVWAMVPIADKAAFVMECVVLAAEILLCALVHGCPRAWERGVDSHHDQLRQLRVCQQRV